MAWLATVTLAVIPKLAAYNQPLLMPALLVLLAHRRVILKGFLPRVLTKGVLACLLWQWVTAAILAVGSLLLGPSRIRVAAGVPEYTLLALPPLTLLAVVATMSCLRDANGRIPWPGFSTPGIPAERRE
jgi:hypothetical protein